MEEEFAAMNAPFKERGKVSDEQLTLLRQLWTEEHINFHGQYYNVKDIAFLPKPIASRACRSGSAAKANSPNAALAIFGDAWFPYFVKVTPQQLAVRLENVRAEAKKGWPESRRNRTGMLLTRRTNANRWAANH